MMMRAKTTVMLLLLLLLLLEMMVGVVGVTRVLIKRTAMPAGATPVMAVEAAAGVTAPLNVRTRRREQRPSCAPLLQLLKMVAVATVDGAALTVACRSLQSNADQAVLAAGTAQCRARRWGLAWVLLMTPALSLLSRHGRRSR